MVTDPDAHGQGAVSQDLLVARFTPDGAYILRKQNAGDVLAPDTITLVYQGHPLLTTDQWVEIHRLLAARAPSYTAANHEGRKQIIALTRLDVESTLARNEEEEDLFRRYLETGDANPY
ncbi:hypothetical protein JCM18882A_27980 [Brevibacterium metallidurans]|uniref:Uncharacterized protein n=1 Tax=Brevibacterium metallidurans TaxID=1482676 RepID=A0ABP3CAK2_9MICO